jgi:hypothetical protein
VADGNFMLMPSYRLVTIQAFDGFDMGLTVFFFPPFREKLQMAYHSLVLTVLFYEGRVLYPLLLICFLNIDTETSLHSFEMHHPTFHRGIVLRSKFAYERIVCSMSRIQKTSCGSTAVRKRWRRMPFRYRNETLCVGNG